jgi:hypothetical protein
MVIRAMYEYGGLTGLPFLSSSAGNSLSSSMSRPIPIEGGSRSFEDEDVQQSTSIGESGAPTDTTSTSSAATDPFRSHILFSRRMAWIRSKCGRQSDESMDDRVDGRRSKRMHIDQCRTVSQDEGQHEGRVRDEEARNKASDATKTNGRTRLNEPVVCGDFWLSSVAVVP